jgi:hypothetical protein
VKPELKYYPCWLRELIFPTEPFGCVSQHDRIDNEKALRAIFDNQRIEPSYRVLAMFVLEVIRNRFKMYRMQQDFEERVLELENRISHLERKNKKRVKP